MVVIGRRWPDGELERISEGETRLLPTKSEEVQLKSDAKL